MIFVNLLSIDCFVESGEATSILTSSIRVLRSLLHFFNIRLDRCVCMARARATTYAKKGDRA